MRRDLRRHLATFDGVRLLVTHDPVDAYALADRVVILDRARSCSPGTLAEVTARPRSRYVADLVGLNLPERHRRARDDLDRLRWTCRLADALDGPVFAVIAPHSVALYPALPEGSPRNVWAVTVSDVDRLADRVRVSLVGEVPLVAEVTPAAIDHLGLRPGAQMWASVKATEVTLYPV